MPVEIEGEIQDELDQVEQGRASAPHLPYKSTH